MNNFYFVRYKNRYPIDAVKTPASLRYVLSYVIRRWRWVSQMEYFAAKLELISAKYHD